MMTMKAEFLYSAIAILLLSFLFFGFLSHNGFPEYDSYFFLVHICGGGPEAWDISPFGISVFDAWPCDIGMLKIMVFSFFVLDAAILFYIGWLFGNPWVFLLFCFISPALLLGALRLENDIIGLPVVYASLFFLLRYCLEKNKRFIDMFLGIVLLGASFLVWGLPFVYVLAFAPLVYPLMLPALILFMFFWVRISYGVMPNFDVGENIPSFGIIWGLLYVYFLDLKNIKFPLPVVSVPVVLIGILNPKFFVFAVPFLAAMVLHAWNGFSDKARFWFVGLALGFLLLWSFQYYPFSPMEVPPTSVEKLAVQDLIRTGIDFNKETSNDWGLGYLVFYYGGQTTEYGGGIYDMQGIRNQIVLSRLDLNCTTLYTYEKPLLGNGLRLYNC